MRIIPRTLRRALYRLIVCAVLLSGSMPLLRSANIIWITENTDATNDPSPDDIGWTDLLTAAGHTVSRLDLRNLDTNDPALADLEAADLVIMSRDTNSGNYTNNATEIARWNGLTTPVILMSAALARSADRLRWFAAGALVNADSFFIQVEEPGHPIFAGITLDGANQFEIADVGVTNPISTATAGNGAVLATDPGNGNVWIASWPANVAFWPGGPIAGGPRIFLAAGAGIASDNPKGGENFTAAGEQAFLNAVALLTNSGTDSDFDGLTDTWEATYFNDLSATASGDPDADGLTNLVEQGLNTHPKSADTDADGLNDKVETNTGTYVGPTNTGTNPVAPDTDHDGLLDGVETNTGSYTSATNTGSSPFNLDTDADTMPDGWEVGFGFNPVSAADGPLDFDTDGLANAAEFAATTNPTVQDSDGDGLRDGAETKTGVFVSASNTGTDPAKADTDADGSLDGSETATGTFVDATHTGTDPNTLDWDTDAFIDGEEVRRGFNPTVATSHPPQLDILFIGANTTPTFGADGAAFSYMETRYGVGNVTYNQASATNTGDELAHDVLVISSTPDSGAMRGKFQDSTTPILNWEEAIADSNPSGEFGLGSIQMSISVTTTLLKLDPHPITAGLPSQITFVSPGAETMATTMLFPGITTVASGANGVISGQGTVGNSMVDLPMLFVAETGQAVDPLAGVTGSISPARRVYFPMRDGTFALLTADGRTLFGQALDWAAGLIGQPSSISIIDVDYLAQVAGPQFTLRWTSDPGRTYNILGSAELSGPRDTWPVLQANVPSAGAETTGTVTLPPGTQIMFFAIRENP